VVLATLGLALSPAAIAQTTRELDELRNTVGELLESLVKQGVITPEQAKSMVAEAQGKAERDALSRQEQDADAAGAARVTYVPQIVKDEISASVRAQITPQVVQDVVAQAKAEQWGVPAALPEWIRGLKIGGDVRVREQADLYASGNAPFSYLNFQRINEKGGIGKAGNEAFLNTTENELLSRVRARLGVEAQLGDNFVTGISLATGNLLNPVSTNQTLEQYTGRFTFGVDQAYIRYDARESADWSWLSVWGGRAANPFLSTDLVWDADLTFQGLAGTYRYGLSASEPASRNVFVTAGAFPIEELSLSQPSSDKWLYAAQLGAAWEFNDEILLRGALAYYGYDNITGIRNSFESTTYNYTAPLFLQKGNTLFDILNDADPATNLFALAAGYQLVDVVVAVDAPVFDDYRLSFVGDYVTNIGWDTAAVRKRTGTDVKGRTDGYQLELGFGYPKIDRLHAWRAAMRYRHLQRDAVLDAFTDSDFHLGGTDAEGYTLRGEYGLGRHVYVTLRYLSANAIDDAPLGIDVVQLDVNGQF
jgi:hypothetical protein